MHPGQIACPDCEAELALPIEAVLAGRPITCACGMTLTVNARASQPALAALARWYEETASARVSAAPAAVPDAAGQPSRRRPGRRHT